MKLKIKEIKIQSFVTQVADAKINGGVWIKSVNRCFTVDFGCETDNPAC